MRQSAALYRGRKVGLYGGSFNPAHDGHLYIAKCALKVLELDEIWFVVSPGNPLKEQNDIAPYESRRESTLDLIKNTPAIKLVELEQQLDTHYTIDMVVALKKHMPLTQFIWIMGGDNLSTFHKWKGWHKIVKSLPIAVFDRSGYALKSISSAFARVFAKKKAPPRSLRYKTAPAWSFVGIPRHPGSATEVRTRVGTKWYMDRKRKET